ncbi:MAG: ABC transporter permease [Blastocatellia bacterium]|nr:MAG: ABC transporter permease [Blastocatellia bacterium]
MFNDIRYGIRSLLKRPAFTLIALVTLALGIGANSAMFSVVNAIVLRPLPYAESQRLMAIWGNLQRTGTAETEISAPEFKDFREQTHTFEQVAAYAEQDSNLTGVGEPERLRGAVVSANLFPTLRIDPQRGRQFLPEEDQFGKDQVAILSDALWKRRFGSDPNIVNRTISLDGRTITVIGVMPPQFHYPGKDTEVWMPLALAPDLLTENNRGSHFLNVVARLNPNATQQQAQTDLDALTSRMSNEHRGTYPNGFTAQVRSLHEDLVGDLRRVMLVLLGAVGLVLAVACANVAHLRLANAAARHREIAIRSALGASRVRVVHQFLTESLLLSLAGGVLGLVTAFWGVRVLVALIPKSIPRIDEIALDSRVVLFTFGLSVLTGIVFGLAPAFQASKTCLNEVLKESGRGTETSRRLRLRSVLVISEFALALVLLIGSGLMVKSFLRVQDVKPGFEPTRLLTARIALPDTKYDKFEKTRAFFEQLFAKLHTRAEVKSVGAINLLPFGGGGGDRSFTIEGRDVPEGQAHPDEQIRFITAGYFQSMDIALLKGRDITERDQPDTPQVLIANQALARKFWPNEEALGKRISFSKRNPKWYELVGIVGNVRHRGLDVEEKPEFYVPVMQPLFADGNVPPMFLTIRTNTDPQTAISVLRSEIASLDPDQPISSVLTMEERIADSVAPRRFNMFLFAMFAALALVLAAIGIYGIMAFSVSQRTQEIGIRMALGASGGDVLRMVLRNGFMLAVSGIAVGLVASFALTRLMTSLLFGVSATDLSTFILDAAVLAIVALAACYIPARRATKVDPLVALRDW